MNWASKKGIIDPTPLGDDFLTNISWSWPRSEELDEYQHQQALQMKLTNMTGSYREVFGNEWRQKLEQIMEEVQWFKDKGLVHPSMKLISGGESKMIDVDNITTEV